MRSGAAPDVGPAFPDGDPTSRSRQPLRVVRDLPVQEESGYGTEAVEQDDSRGEETAEAPSPPPPPPPLPATLPPPVLGTARDAVQLPIPDPATAIQRLELELTAARDEVEALHQMLEDLPEIFERKFRQRLQTVLDHQQLLLVDNQSLRERLYALGPAGESFAGPVRASLPAGRVSRRGRLREALRTALRFRRGG